MLQFCEKSQSYNSVCLTEIQEISFRRVNVARGDTYPLNTVLHLDDPTARLHPLFGKEPFYPNLHYTSRIQDMKTILTSKHVLLDYTASTLSTYCFAQRDCLTKYLKGVLKTSWRSHLQSRQQHNRVHCRTRRDVGNDAYFLRIRTVHECAVNGDGFLQDDGWLMQQIKRIKNTQI